jgi:ATP-binding cassette subfamily B protein
VKFLQRWFHSYRVASRFFVDLSAFRGKLALVCLCAVGVAGLEILRPWTIKWIIDYALGSKPVHLGFKVFGHHVSVLERFEDWATPGRVILFSGAIFVIATVGTAILSFAREVQSSLTSNGVTRAIRYRVFSHMAHLSPSFHARHKSGDLLVRLMGDASMVTNMLVDTTVDALQRGLMVVGTVAIMLKLDPWLTLGMGASVPVLLLLVRFISGSIRTASRKQREKEGDLADYLHEAIAATETIQSMGSSAHVVRRFARDNRRTARAGVKASRIAARLSSLVETTLGITTAGVLVFAAFRASQGLMTIGEFTVFFSYTRSLLKPLRATSKNAARVSKGTACGERLLAILDSKESIRSAPDAPPAPAQPAELAFQDVTFSYRGEIPALRDFTATFRRGELSALVGRSGAGKSTIAALALRLFDPEEGVVRLDGRSLRDYDLDSVRGRMGLAQQRTAFFGESMRENMLISVPEATDEEIWHALELAGAADFVRGLEGDLDAKLGSNGVGLSGGQLSRLSLARTLLRRAPVLIVDEPFAGLDLASAKRVADTLQRLARECILVVIAHDLERLDAYDHIVFIESGRKVAEGRHEDLLGREPLYREIVRTSAGVRA